MLEILLVIGLCWGVGGRLEDKGYPGGWYQFFTIIGWFGGQFAGAFAAAVACAVLDDSREHLGLVNLGAIAGASFAVGLVVWFASALPDSRRPRLAAELAPAENLTDRRDDGDNPYRMPKFSGPR